MVTWILKRSMASPVTGIKQEEFKIVCPFLEILQNISPPTCIFRDDEGSIQGVFVGFSDIMRQE